MIELIDICKIYPNHHGGAQKFVLDHATLGVNPGEKWSILGCNGGEKSTLIRIISGSDKPHSGQIRKTMTRRAQI